MQYQYWLVRYVPDTLRGEFVNVGIVVGAEGKDWSFRRPKNMRRANRLGGNVSSIEPWLLRIERSVRDREAPPLEPFVRADAIQLSTSWAKSSRQRLNNALRLSEPTPVEANSAAEAADLLFPLLVGEVASVVHAATRRRLVSELHRSYELQSLDDGRLLQRPKARVGRQRGRFDFAVFGDQVDQLSQVWSFDVRDLDSLAQEMQSWSYLVTRLRNEGGEIYNQNLLGEPQISSDVEISVVYQEPAQQTPERVDTFLAARESWDQLNVRAVPSSQLQQVAHEARVLVDA